MLSLKPKVSNPKSKITFTAIIAAAACFILGFFTSDLSLET